MLHKKFNWRIAAAVIALDQLNKLLAEKFFPNLVSRNSDLPFGIKLPSAFMDEREFFYFTIIAISFVIFLAAVSKFFGTHSVGPSLIIGGALSNLADRAAFGSVRDFLSIGSGTLNLADLAVFAGIIVLLWNIKSDH